MARRNKKLESFRARQAAVARVAREKLAAKQQATDTAVPAGASKVSDPYRRLLDRIDADNNKAGGTSQ
jgi:hypothetical protein